MSRVLSTNCEGVKMKVAVCYSKKTPRETEIIKAFHQGIKASSKDQVLVVNNVQTCKAIVPQVDVAVMYGWFNPTLGVGSKKAIRHKVYDTLKEKGKQVIVIDTTFIGSDDYVSIGIGGIKNYANFCIPSDVYLPDRWELIKRKENLELKPWREWTKDGHILIIGQNRFGVSSYDIDVWKWHVEIAEKLLQLEQSRNREIKFRIHPRGRYAQALENFPKDPRITISQDNKPLKEDLKNCHCVITYTSNAVCECLLEGIPCLTLSKGSPAWDITFHSLDYIDDPPHTDRRTQWLFDLCYKQWSIDEIRKGLPWLHLKKCI